ncbi:putative sucrose utilization SUC1-like protein [Cladobotryum mycophilum]|uniref:Sucrose utilization SUC1-like protein n=1 Tax=Cladobotryum mycophilum TaxID=491253 RepID=A0ABR0SYE0_9HYPO
MAKRSCDCCVQRKTRCDNGKPCRKCMEAKPPLECTYTKPVLKRGPKTSKLTQRSNWRWLQQGDLSRQTSEAPSSLGSVADLLKEASCDFGPSNHAKPQLLPLSILEPVVEAYQSRMYPVWPLIDPPDLHARLRNLETADEPDLDAYTMLTAMCSATMAQLNLDSIDHLSSCIDSAYMEQECRKTRNLINYRQHPSMNGVLASFFLHVYHAKVDNRNAAMMYLQEAISIARLLRLDHAHLDLCRASDERRNKEMPRQRLIYLFLWVSERGYGIQHDLPISTQETLMIPSSNSDEFDEYWKGFIELASLFAAFDSSFYRIPAQYYGSFPSSDRQRLVSVHGSLEKHIARSTNYDLVQRADYNITKHWMRTLLWQQAMSRGLLSSMSDDESMTFVFPSQIAKDLLTCITTNTTDDLVALGRDQLIKSFEIANTLADVVLCINNTFKTPSFQTSTYTRGISPPRSRSIRSAESRECWRYGPADYLHGLYQRIAPFLTYDKQRDEMLRVKAGEALLLTPCRIVPRGLEHLPDTGEDNDDVSANECTDLDEMIYDVRDAEDMFYD